MKQVVSLHLINFLFQVSVPIRKGKVKQKIKIKTDKHVKFEENKDTEQPSKSESKASRISSYDYDAWSRFDVVSFSCN